MVLIGRGAYPVVADRRFLLFQRGENENSSG